jgi:hypothetical protein
MQYYTHMYLYYRRVDVRRTLLEFRPIGTRQKAKAHFATNLVQGQESCQ